MFVTVTLAHATYSYQDWQIQEEEADKIEERKYSARDQSSVEYNSDETLFYSPKALTKYT